ncbi:GNS1/SUR4 membrane protein [Aspergillus campestris IBT 28561]|uniref:Elongation of fatty acids protein n=1 Tax=Aspergillus campestris (strain IBT 28561) TaxID=1392248 RepID=A0A2I1D1T1_ASPC2|nr:GNS1/SUR4 membrane protein [Aspergillus campestris IBT 28561]PKY03816.1 GNS1/SUR4 membrane protein [Aspergillus campestris IBT 28561]
MDLEFLKNVPRPTIDRPFGIHLWPIFDKAFEMVVGYPASEFDFKAGVTPMSTIKETVIGLVAYYVIIFGGRALMKNREPFKLNLLFMIHNFYLTAISATLLVLFIEQLVPTIWNHGIFFAICDHNGGWTQPLIVLYYLNYLTKYLELLDTVFLFLKKKPLTFLHTYHHGATALLCYTQLIGLTAVQWVVIDINLLVHVVMYWYYFQSARGIRITWKEWITRLQIIQFVIDLGFVYFASYTYFTSSYFPELPNMGVCAGEEFAAFAGMGILSSYLFLFISFYIATYNKTKSKAGRPRRNTGRQAVIDMAKFEVAPAPGAQAASANGTVPSNGSAVSTGRSNGPVTRSRKA